MPVRHRRFSAQFKAAAACEGARRQRVEPLVREYESTMLREHAEEFGRHLQALGGPVTGG